MNKFRVWDKENKEYINTTINECRIYANGELEVLFDPQCDDGISGFYWEKVKDKYIVEHYTGLNDKNGKEIFENDVVYFFNSLHNEYLKGVVKYSQCQFYAHPLNIDLNQDISYYWLSSPDMDLCIINNIHECRMSIKCCDCGKLISLDELHMTDEVHPQCHDCFLVSMHDLDEPTEESEVQNG